jgi:catechol 2,3-dioxygenase-like lactoylglutathione lyase family enzyme
VEVLSCRTIIHPSDLARSLAFYGETLGLAVAREFGDGDQRGVVFFAGSGLIEVVGKAEKPPGPPPLALWLQVRSVEAAVAELGARDVPIAREPRLEPWGLVEAWIEDPDGLRIHLVEVPPDHPLRRDLRPVASRS